MRDMTTGNPVRHIVGFAIPMLIGNIFQQIYNVVDTMIVGKYLGENALAGVGSTGTLSFLLLSLVFGLCTGAGLIIAQAFGSKENEKLKAAVAALVWVAAIASLFITVVGFSFAPGLLRVLSVPDNCINYSTEYIRIIFLFTTGTVAYNAASSVLRSTGDSKTPLYALIAASLINVALDIVFVLFLNLGVKGVGYATGISQIISALITIVFIIRKRNEIGLTNINWMPQSHDILLIVRTGFPAAFQSCMIALGGLLVQRLINSFGASVMAAYVAANKIDSVAIQVIVSIGTALSVFTGQNIGQNSFDRIKEGMYKTLVIMVGASFLIAVCVLSFRYQLLSLFLDANASPKATEVGVTYLSIIGIAYVIAGVMNTYINVIKGAGDVGSCMVAGLTELGGRIVFAYLLAHFIGITGVWIATPISWGCGCVIPVIRYYSGKWKTKKLV